MGARSAVRARAVDLDLPGLESENPRPKDSHELARRRRDFLGFVNKARDISIGKEIPERILQQWSRLMNPLWKIADEKPEKQLEAIEKWFWDPNRPGGDCDAYGSWEPRFLAELYRLIAENAGLPPNLEGSGIERGDDTVGATFTGSGVSIAGWKPRYLRTGE
jgi:hypothetical protein